MNINEHFYRRTNPKVLNLLGAVVEVLEAFSAGRFDTRDVQEAVKAARLALCALEAE